MELSIRLPQRAGAHVSNCPCPLHFFKREDINSMKKSYTRIIAFLLSVVMCIGLLPVVSFAAPVQPFPKIDSLTKNEGAKLLCANNHTYDRTIVSVEHTEYEEAIPEKSQLGDDDLVVGEVTIYIDEAMQGDYVYKLSDNALSVTAKNIPEGYGTDIDNFWPAQFSTKTSVYHSNSIANNDNDIWYVYRVKIAVAEAPVQTFPKIDSLTKNEGAKLLCVNNHTYDRTIVSVEHTEYDTPEEKDGELVVGEVTVYIDEAMQGDFNYKPSDNALNVTFKDVPTGYDTDFANFMPLQFSNKWSEKHSGAFVYDEGNEIYYVYKVKIAVAEAPVQTFPKIDTLTKNEGAKLLCVNNHTYDRTIVSVEHTEYDTPEEKDGELVVGEVTVYIDEAMQGDFNYKPSDNALNVTFKDVPTGYDTDFANFMPLQFSNKWSEKHSGAFVYDEGNEIYYVYKVKIAVARKEFDYPVLKSLSTKNGAALIGLSDKSTISITGATFENYDSARDIQEGGYPAKVAGKVTIYISKAPADQKYQLLAKDFDAEYTSKEGFELNTVLQGFFSAGSTSSLSVYYAYNESQDCEYLYDLELKVGYQDDGVYVLDGTGTRIAPTKARVSFNANQAGTYHYAVVDAAATDVPAMPNTGAAMTTGENTFVIDGLGEGAKKVYIWGKNGEKVSARPLVVEIGAEAKSYSLTFDTTTATTDGILRITADGKDVSFKTKIMVTPTTEAKGIYEGQLVTVWMGNPHTDKDLSAVALRNVTNVTIAPDKNSFSFTMPAADVYGTSNDWRTYVDSTETRYTLTGIASTFDQTNVSGIKMGHVVFKDEGGNIITQATSGTKVTATPVPSTTANYTLEFQFTEWSDATGFTLADADKTKETLTFTVGSKNISLKANFKPVGTKVTWGTDITSADANAPQVSMPGSVSSPFVFKPQSTAASISGTAWYDRYEFEGWVITRDGVTLTGDDVNTSQAVGNPGTPGYWTYAKFDISGNEMTVTANFRERAFAAVTAAANDPAMGSAAVAIGNGEASPSQSVVFEGQTVTLTATPGERYMLKGWEVKDTDNTTVEYTVAEDVKVATFTMPATGKDITAKAIFEVDPAKASTACDLSNVTLNIPGAISERSGTKYTIKVPANTDEAALAKAVLKFEISKYAAVKKTGEADNWPAEGKACGMTLDTPVTFTVTAEDGKTMQDYTLTITKAKSSEKDITAVKLLNANKSVIAEGKLSGTTWTITLPSDTDKALINKIGTSTDVFMQINYTGVSLAQAEGYDDATGSIGKWPSGNVMCGVSPNSSNTFTVTAEDGSTKTYTVAIKYTAPNAPTLSNGSATRTSKTGATVKFTSSEAGSYFYKVVDHGAAAPTVVTGKNGTAAVQGENTITLSNLTEDARDIYIVVVGAAGGESAALKVEIPAYGSGSETPDTGKFTITINAPKGGTITTNRTKADKGDEIIVTVKPDSGYQMVEGSLTYSLAVAGGETVKITGNRFTMPAGNVTITCKWETATVASSGITGFSINGVAGAVNNSTNTITITMPRGTDVTKLTPVIATNGVKSLTPGTGETVDFTNAVTYTAAMEDGSSKTYTVTVYVDKGTLADQFWDKLTDFATQVPWWQYAEKQQSTSKYPKYW